MLQNMKYLQLFGVLLFSACDMITDLELKLDGNIYAWYATGNGVRIVEMNGASGTDIVNADVQTDTVPDKKEFERLTKGLQELITTMK